MGFLSGVIEQLSSTWIANIVAIVAIGLSATALKRSGPHVRVQLKSAIMMGQGPSRWNGRSAVIVTVTNNGSSPVRIQRVSLSSVSGGVAGEPAPGTPALPCSIEAHGGSGVWLFDRQDLRETAAHNAGEEEVSFRATVLSGSVKYTSKQVETVHPDEPAKQPRKKLGRMERMCIRLSALVRPHVQPINAVVVDGIHFEKNTYELCIRNFGGGFARGATLELLSDEESGRRKRIAPPIKVPTLWRRRSVLLTVPLQEQEGLTWWIRYQGRLMSGVGAMTRAEASRLVAEHGHDRESPP